MLVVGGVEVRNRGLAVREYVGRVSQRDIRAQRDLRLAVATLGVVGRVVAVEVESPLRVELWLGIERRLQLRLGDEAWPVRPFELCRYAVLLLRELGIILVAACNSSHCCEGNNDTS